jgi:hypothetical protein
LKEGAEYQEVGKPNVLTRPGKENAPEKDWLLNRLLLIFPNRISGQIKNLFIRLYINWSLLTMPTLRF